MPKSNPVTPNKQPPEDWNQLLFEFGQKAGRGLQKTFIRKLWAVHEDLLANANPSSLRMMFYSPALLNCTEGVKLVAEILIKIGIANGMTIVESSIMKLGVTDTECQRYGDVFKTAWTNAYEDGNFDLTEEIENDVIRLVCQYALYGHKQTSLKFRKLLNAFAQEKKKGGSVDEMISRILNGCIYRALEATNYVVKLAAVEVFFMFFPLVGDEIEDVNKTVENQLRYMSDLLSSDIVALRTIAVPRVMKALSDFWNIVPKDIAKELLRYIIDELSRDTVVAVRVAVYDGLNEMAFSPSCLAVFEHSLKCVARSGIMDSSERVRLAAYQTISRMKHHKFISIFDILNKSDMVSVLAIENVEECRRQLIPIMHVLLPISKTLEESYYRPRVNYLIETSRQSLLSYFRLLGPMKIIDPIQASNLIQMFNMWAYRYLRKKDKPLLPENSEPFQKARAYLECSLIIYMSCKKMLLFDCDASVKAKCDQLLGKIVKEIFENYGNTPILGTATAISSVIPKESLKSIAHDVLARLADDEVPEEAVEPFLESAIHFNPESVFNSFSEGLDVFEDLYGEQTKQLKKKKRDVGDPDETLSTTLRRMKYIVQSHSTSSLLATNDTFKQKTLELNKKIDMVREAIEVRLVKGENEERTINDESLLLALEFRFILPLYAVSENEGEEKERKAIIESTKALLNWFQNNIASKFDDFEEHNEEFAIRLCVIFFNCINVALSAYDFKTRSMEYEDEADENQPPDNDRGENDDDDTTVAVIVAKIVNSFINSRTPIEVFVAALRVGTTLCDELYSESHPTMATILKFAPKWLNNKCDTEGEEITPDQEKEIVETLRQFYKKVSETDVWDDKLAQSTIGRFLTFSVISVTKNHDVQEYEDPRHENYQPPKFISIALIKFILKEKNLSYDFLDEISRSYLPEDCVFFTPHDDGGPSVAFKLSRLAVMSHFMRIVQRYSKYRINYIEEVIQTCTTRVSDCFANSTKSELRTVAHHIMNSLSSLLDVNLPDEY